VLLAVGVAGLFSVIICGCAVQGVLPAVVVVLYLVMSIGAMIAYRVDKSAAYSGAWRTSESTLHVLAVLGGWPGAAVAQRIFRHKSRKPSFQVTFWVTVGVNCAALALVWWLVNS
jgi:uncharacterized membrane protein YsdA (DUF1294 family)